MPVCHWQNCWARTATPFSVTTPRGFLHTPLDQVLKNVVISRENGIGGIKLKVGQPNCAEDIRRLTAVREALGDEFPLMVDANQQWDRETAIRMGRKWNSSILSGLKNH